MDNIEIACRILEVAKKRKIEYCEQNGIPIPAFDKEEDFVITYPRPTAMWNKIWRCTYCNSAFEFAGYSCLPDTCPNCKAIMTNC